MQPKMYIAVRFLIISAISAWTAGADTTAIRIPRLSGIEIDGQFGDWSEKGYYDALLLPVKGDPRDVSNSNAELRLGWDSRGLLVKITVNDDSFVEEDDSTALYKGDGIELFLSPRRGTRDIGQWVISPGMDPDHPRIRTRFFDQRKNPDLKKRAAPLKVRRAAHPDGYELEALVEWGSLGIDPATGKEVAFQAIVNDRDSETENSASYRTALYPELDSYRNSNAMKTLRLSEQSDLPVQAKMNISFISDSGQFRVTVWGRKDLVGRDVDLSYKGKTPATGRLGTLGGRSNATLTIPAETIEDSLSRLELLSNGEKIGAHVLVGFDSFGGLLNGTQFLRKRFKLDEPFKELSSEAPFVQRHRGLAELAIYWIENFGSDREIHESMIHFAAEFARAVRNGEKEFLENQRGEFWSAYFSTADGSGQPFVTAVPENYNPEKKYPLMVVLHGLGGRPRPNPGAPPSEEFLKVEPWGRGDTWYAGLGENDVLQVIEYMKRWYSIDEDRVYVTGGSMGGRGTWALASRHPDLFAAAGRTYGWADGLPLENLLNVPVLNQHGDEDWVVSVDQSRYAVDRLRRMNSPVLYKEHPGAGHSIKKPIDKYKWALSHTRNNSPRRIRYTCGTPEMGKAYWTVVRQMKSPHRDARVSATVDSTKTTQSITFGLENVGVLRVDLARAPLDPAIDVWLQCNQQIHKIAAPFPHSLFLVDSAGTYVVRERWTSSEGEIRPYRAGAAANLYDGEPFVVVYGSVGDQASCRARRLWAERLAKFGGAMWKPMSIGGARILADTMVNDRDLEQYNMLLIGGPEENRLVAKMWDHFPFTVNRKNELVVANRKPLPLDSAGIRFAYYNPLSPKRLIFLITVPRSPTWMEQNLNQAPFLLTGSWGTDRPFQADLIVADPRGYGLGNRCKRAMQFTYGWDWRNIDGIERPILPAFHSETHRARAEAQFQKRIADVDYVLFHNDSDRIFCDTSTFTLADQRVTGGGEKELIAGELSGEELVKILPNKSNTPVEVYPRPIMEDLSPDETYRVAVTPMLTWELTKLKTSLRNVKAIRYASHELWDDLFSDD